MLKKRPKHSNKKNPPFLNFGFLRAKPSPLPIKLKGRKLYIFPNRQGILLFIVLFIMLIGSMNYNNNLGFIFTFLLGGISFISLLHTHQNLAGITLVSISAARVFASETAKIKVTLRPVRSFHHSLKINFTDEKHSMIDLSGLKDQSIELNLKTSERGYIKFPPLIISTSYPIGIFRAWGIIKPDTGFIVYPSIIDGPLQTSKNYTGADNSGKYKVSGVDDFKGIRNYIPGDSTNRIFWKAFSKGQGLHVKEFNSYGGGDVIFDWSRLPETDIENKISRLCGMVIKAHSLNLPYGLSLPGISIEPCGGKNKKHMHDCLKALAIFQQDNKT